jgi:hypothetical protein
VYGTPLGGCWTLLAQVVEKARAPTRNTSIDIDAAKKDSNLSDIGRLRRYAQIGSDAIKKLSADSTLGRATEAINNYISDLDKKIGTLTKAAPPSDQVLASEIRTFVRRQ